MILLLVMADGTKREFRPEDSVRHLLTSIGKREVETIVAGDIEGGVVHWEKQFNACTVMPTDFGQKENANA